MAKYNKTIRLTIMAKHIYFIKTALRSHFAIRTCL